MPTAAPQDNPARSSPPRHPSTARWMREGTDPKGSIGTLGRKSFRALLADHVFGHGAELGFYFLFSLFPTLFCASAILGLVAQSAHQVSDKLLQYLALVIPTSAFTTVLNTFNQTTAAASSGKLTFGLVAALWSASVGISAIQDTLNEVFKLEDRRSYFVARIEAILLTLLLTAIVGSALACMFASDFVALYIHHTLNKGPISLSLEVAVRVVAWALAACLLALSFAVLYYWAPDWPVRRWRWLSAGTIIGVSGWLIVSLGLRIYLHFFNDYSVTYGSLGAVIILLTWFYISGLTLLLGAEINKVIGEQDAGQEHEVPQTSSGRAA